ncbi:MAG: TonB-dependent receptor [Arenicella sp.]|nr:TonB-dependent receptor [Arenicella sp.]
MRNFNKTAIAAFLVAGAVSTSEQVLAQGSRLLEEVVVTAQKKGFGESVQDVPISISAFSGDQAEAMFAVNLTDIGLATPNASLTEIPTFPGVANFVIRGMGTVGQSIPSADPAVGVSIDGVALGTIYGVVTDLFDLEAIEVLRGPQGTLLGRNVTGGAVSIRTTRPGDEFVGKVRVGLGNFGKVEGSVVLSGPLNDNWGAKLAVLTKDRDGYFDAPNIGGRIGESKTTLIRPAISYKNDTFDATLILENGKIEADGLSAITFEADGQTILDPYERRISLQDQRGSSELDWTQVTFEANADLWGGKATSILGYRELEQEGISDVDGFTGARFHFADGTGLEQDQSSLELRWSGQVSDRINLTTGIYLFDQEYTYSERRILVDAVDRRGVSTIEHSTQGVFAQADIVLNDNLSLIIGGRYTKEQKDAAIGVIGDPTAVGDCATVTPPLADDFPQALADCRPALIDDEDWSNFTPKVGINWNLADDVLAFASFTRGFRSGGYNVRFTDLTFITSPDNPTSTPGPYNEESVDAFELGIKSKFLNGRVRLNASVFNNEFDDLQRTSLNAAGGQEILNAASGTISGFEIDTVIGLSENLVFQAGLGYTDASYDSFASAEAQTGLSASELDFVLAPKTTFSAAATYDWNIGAESFISGRLAYAFVDDSVSDDFNTVRNEAYDFIDASLTYNSDTGLKVSLYGKNITDEVYYDFGTNFSSSALAVRSFWLTPPRTYGVEVTYEF